jgi:hypothetical protein
MFVAVLNPDGGNQPGLVRKLTAIFATPQDSSTGDQMRHRKMFAFAASLAVLACSQSAAAATLVVSKIDSCTCCEGWAKQMKKAGFTVELHGVQDVAPLEKRLGVPDRLRSCHIAQIGNYVIVGHVPAADVKRLLAMKNKATGLAVPGMVIGSPGMDTGGRPEHYKVILFDKSGKTSVFASY